MSFNGVNIEKDPGYLVLEAIGKTVLRPGGIKYTKVMLDLLNISKESKVVEFAPGAGKTTKMVLKKKPENYTIVERNEKFAKRIENLLVNTDYSCLVGSADKTNLKEGSSSIVFGEAMLTMQPSSAKNAIIGEASRILEKGGLFAIHEVGLKVEGLTDALRDEIYEDLRSSLKVGAKPLTIEEWTTYFNENGFDVVESQYFPMKVFSPKAFIGDEGLFTTIKIMSRIARNRLVRKRVADIRGTFKKHANQLQGLLIIAKKR